MELTLFLLFLVIGSIEVHFSLDSGPELLRNPSVTSDNIEMVLELALESLKLGQKCRHSKHSCCKIQTLKGRKVLQTDSVCFLFGKGQCEARFNIPNYSRYVKLAKKVKKSNYRESRLNRRWFSIDVFTSNKSAGCLDYPINRHVSQAEENLKPRFECTEVAISNCSAHV